VTGDEAGIVDTIMPDGHPSQALVRVRHGKTYASNLTRH
jgi:hypothetical protein